MKIKDGLVLREVAGSYVVMNSGGELNFNGMITLNESGAIIWRGLEEGLSVDEIAAKITAEYDIDAETAIADIKRFTDKMSEAGVIE